MRIGFHTLPWGARITDIERSLDIVARVGYKGVELAQRPDLLGVEDVDELLKLLEERELVLLSISGGTLEERMEFMGNARSEYFYVKPWDLSSLPAVVERGFTPALHPGVFTPIRRIVDVSSHLKEHPRLKLLLDTAHMTIAGDDPLVAISSVIERIAAVHFKDWTPEFGRFGHRYSRGFRELGEGIVDLDSILSELRRLRYTGWLVAELDQYCIDQTSNAIACAEWFAKRNLLPEPPEVQRGSAEPLLWAFPRRGDRCALEAEARFREALMFAASEGVEMFYAGVAEAFNELFPCRLITVWACSPAQDQMGLIISKSPTSLDIGRGSVLRRPNDLLVGIAIDQQSLVTHFDLTEELPGQRFGYPDRQFAHPELIEKMGLKWMITLPIYNSGNHNFARLVVNLFPTREEIPITDDELYWLGRAVTIATDSMLDRICSSAAMRVNLLANQCDLAQSFLDGLLDLIQESIHCEGTTIFLVNELGDKLEVAASTGIDWLDADDEPFYGQREGLTGTVWARKDAFVTVDSRNEPNFKGKSTELVQKQDEHACLWVSLIDSNNVVIGIMRCRNKCWPFPSVVPNMFLDDDTAVLDAIGQAVVPHLQILLEKERRTKALSKLSHELRVPLVAIRGAADCMRRTPGVDRFFDYDYPDDVWSWSELMRRLLGNADLASYSSKGLSIQATLTFLRADVIAPAVKQVGILLRERGFSVTSIDYGRFSGIPELWVDQNQFQQVVFNLLANAIKHCYADHRRFRVDIEGRREGNEFVIQFRDMGPGIPAGLEEMIFKEGYRTPQAIERDITGQGLGLWVVRQVVEAHGGSVKVTHLRRPTEFTIYLPVSLAERPPGQRTEGRRK